MHSMVQNGRQEGLGVTTTSAPFIMCVFLLYVAKNDSDSLLCVYVEVQRRKLCDLTEPIDKSGDDVATSPLLLG